MEENNLNLVEEPNVVLEPTKPNTIVVQMPAENYDQNNLVEVLEAVEALLLPLLQKLRRQDSYTAGISEALKNINTAIDYLLEK